MKLRDLPLSAIIYVEYERIRCINWFVVWKRVPGSQLALKKTWRSVALCLEKYDERRRVRLCVVAIIKRSKRLDS